MASLPAIGNGPRRRRNISLNGSIAPAIVIALIGVIGSISVTFINSASGYLDSRSAFMANYSGATFESGDFAANFADQGWTLDRIIRDSNGDTTWRSYPIEIKFEDNFTEAPQVLTNITLFYASNEAHVRFMIYVEHVEKDGCELVLRSWGDSKIYWVEGSWLAIQRSPDR